MTSSSQYCSIMLSLRYILCPLIVASLVLVVFSSEFEMRSLEDEEKLYLEEYKQFEKELEMGGMHSQSKERSKRFVIFNTRTHFDVALLLGIPMTTALPSLSNSFNGRRRRNSDDEEVFEDHPVVQPYLDRIASYFELIKVPDRSCQLRAICEFSSEPEKYFPVSELVLAKIRNPVLHATVEEENGYPILYQEAMAYYYSDQNSTSQTKESQNKGNIYANHRNSLFDAFNKAADQGQAYGHKSCSEKFSKQCKYSMDKLLNMPALQYWSLLSTLLKFSIKDTNL